MERFINYNLILYLGGLIRIRDSFFRKGLVISVIILFILLALTPIGIGIDTTVSEEDEYLEKLAIVCSERYGSSKLEYYKERLLSNYPDSDLLESNNIIKLVELQSTSIAGGHIDSAWPMYQHDAANTGFSEASFPNSFNQRWFKSYHEDLNMTMISMFASPVASNDKIYITGDLRTTGEQQKWSSIICALNQNNGSLIWKKEIPISKDAGVGFHGFHSPAVYEGKIITTRKGLCSCCFFIISKLIVTLSNSFTYFKILMII